MAFVIEIDFTAEDVGTKTYSILREGYGITEEAGAKGQHCTQSASVAIRSREAAILLLSETAKHVNARIKVNSTVVFEGVVRPYQTVTAHGAHEGNLDLEILDFTEKLHKTIGGDGISIYATNLKACVEALLDLADLPVVLKGATTLAELAAKDIPYFNATDKEYVDNVLAELLYEYGYDFRFVPGYCEIIKTTAPSTVSQYITDIRNTLTVSRDDNWSDGVEVDYGNAAQLHDAKIGSAFYRFDGTGIYVPWTYQDFRGDYPSSKKVNWDIKIADPNLKNATILYVSNPRVDLHHEFGSNDVSYTLGNYNAQGAEFWMSYYVRVNSLWGYAISPCTIEASIFCDVVYKVDDQETYGVIGDNPKKVTTRYVYNATDAQKLAKMIQWRETTAPVTYSFSSLTAYNVGEFYNITETVTGISTRVRVISRSIDANGIYSYNCEGAAEVDAIDVALLQIRDLSDSGKQFLAVAADKTEVFSGENVTLSLVGDLPQPGTGSQFSFKWYLGSVQVGTGRSITLQATELAPGQNTVSVRVGYDEQTIFTDSVEVISSATGSGAEIEYALGDDANIPPTEFDGQIFWNANNVFWDGNRAILSNNPWSSESPTPERGKYIWIRTR